METPAITALEARSAALLKRVNPATMSAGELAAVLTELASVGAQIKLAQEAIAARALAAQRAEEARIRAEAIASWREMQKKAIRKMLAMYGRELVAEVMDETN